ncbi:MAG: undecaprenyl-diphosphate phosphatase, partial [Duncaniella sp.]|nr:undecaprenyl-diphosphate phosphatase [Duncaniella sp.]
IVVLWNEFVPLCKSFFTIARDDKFFYVCKILLSCIPVAIVGLFFKSFVEQFFGDGLTVVGCCLFVTAILLSFAYFFRNPQRERVEGIKWHDIILTGAFIIGCAQAMTVLVMQLFVDGLIVVGCCLFVTAILLAFAYLVRNLQCKRVEGIKGHDITWTDAFIIGCAQAVAVLPGLSRSGTTIATGLLLGDKRDKIAQFSFFMVIIPILGEALLSTKDLIAGEGVGAAVGTWPLVIGFLASFIVGCIACKWMINIVKKGKLIWF